MTPLFPDVAEQLREVADRMAPPAPAGRRTPAHRTSRHRLALLAASAAALSAVVVVATSVLPSDAPTPANLLTPRDAVAGALARLDTDGILEWTDRQSALSSTTKRTSAQQPTTVIHRWIDLKNGDGRLTTVDTNANGAGERRVSGATTWNVGHTSWLEEGQVSKTTGKRVVRKTIVAGKRAPAVSKWTPVARLRRTLQRAEAGKLPIREAGSIRGVAVVVITDRRPGFTTRTWVTRERSPRIVRSALTNDCPNGMNCSLVSDDGSAHGGTTSLSETLTWKIHPRADTAAVASVRAPTFDPTEYQVVVTRRSR